MNELRETEEQAISECREGQIEGLRVLYEAYKERVFRTCLRILGDPWIAEDATQEVFLRVFEKMASFNGRSSFSTWLYRVTINHTLNLRQQERRRKKYESSRQRMVPRPQYFSDVSFSPREAVERKERSERFQTILSGLPPDRRTILVLREIEGLSYREIAEVQGIPLGTVMSRLSRARQDFKERWQDEQNVAPE